MVGTFDFDRYAHRSGDPDCAESWCGREYPKKCSDSNCPGLVHANFGDEDANGDYWLATRCDVCGEPE